jgi:hypothetical protein
MRFKVSARKAIGISVRRPEHLPGGARGGKPESLIHQ